MKKVYTLALGLLPLFAFSQSNPLTHDDYDGWMSIRSSELSDDGRYTVVATAPQRGDGYVELIRNSNGRAVRFDRATNPQLSGDNSWLIVEVNAPYDEVRRLKLADTKKEDMPMSMLVKYHIRSGRMDTIHEVEDYKVHGSHGSLLAYRVADEKEVEEVEEPVDSSASETDFLDAEENSGVGYTDKKAKRMILWNLSSDHRDTVLRVSKYSWAEDGKALILVQAAGDSAEDASLHLWNGEWSVADSQFEDIAQMTLSDDGTHAAWTRTSDSAEADIRFYDLREKRLGDEGEAITLLEAQDDQLYDGWMISTNGRLAYGSDGSLFLQTAPIPVIYEEDTTILDEEKVHLDIWSWTDVDIQPMQKVNSNSDKNKSYMGRWDGEKFVQLEDERLENVRIPMDHVVQYAAAYHTPDDSRLAISWQYPTAQDLYVVDIYSGERRLIVKEVNSWPAMSPEGKFIYWYDPASREWKAWRMSDGQDLVLSANVSTPIWDEENDIPSDPSAYGAAGWTAEDESFVLYDAFDIWSVTPGGAATNLTAGKGRANRVRYRYVNLRRDEPHLPSEEWMLSTFNENDKSSGYVEFDLQSRRMETLIHRQMSVHSLEKADSADVYSLRMETVSEYPEIYVSRGDDLDDARKLTSTNPQQSEYRWPTAELVHWTTPKGYEMEGLLYKPNDFDPNKKYPMLVYFYETYSDQLHRHYSPAPSASVINFPYYVSNEYLIFIPDVVYEEGHPGASAEECILSGAEMMAQESWVDASRMAIQGQSWGGYQVAHLVTRTDMFRCGMAGAPVSNMTSAYGGIRWGSGMSRAFQYERTQSRIGGTLWERTDLYLENSPLFYADQVQTPLLIMHNDGDGAVPWYQGIEYFMALRRLRKPVWMLVYNGEEHNLMQRHNRVDLSIRMAQFFDYYLKDAPAPAWMANGRLYNDKENVPATELINTEE